LLHHLTSWPREQTSEPYPCLVLLHGRGSNEQDLFGLVPELPKQCLVVSVRAPLAFPFGGFAWYDLGQRQGAPDQATLNSSLDELRSFLKGLPEQYPVDAAKLFLLGFSQGALMSGTLTVTSPELVAATAMLSGYLPEELDVAAEGIKGKPIFQAHGTYDGTLPVALGRQARLRLEDLGADVEYHEYAMDHQVMMEELVHLNAWFEKQGLK